MVDPKDLAFGPNKRQCLVLWLSLGAAPSRMKAQGAGECLVAAEEAESEYMDSIASRI